MASTKARQAITAYGRKAEFLATGGKYLGAGTMALGALQTALSVPVTLMGSPVGGVLNFVGGMSLMSMGHDALKKAYGTGARGRVIEALVQHSRGNSAGLALARVAAKRSNAEQRQTSLPAPAFGGTTQTSVPGTVLGDGQTDSYSRIQNGHSVFVRGYNTPKR